jgi:hypothetical protein
VPVRVTSTFFLLTQKKNIYIYTYIYVHKKASRPEVFNLSGSAGRIENCNEACGPLSYTAVFTIVRWFPARRADNLAAIYEPYV